jgi:hypothetical protein
MTIDPPLLLDASIWVAAYDVDDRFYDNSRELTFDNALNAAALDLTLFEVADVVAKRWGGFSAAIERGRPPARLDAGQHRHQGPCLQGSGDHARRRRLISLYERS